MSVKNDENLRKKQLAIIKAQNELLQECKDVAKKLHEGDETAQMDVNNAIDEAIKSNMNECTRYLGYNEEDIDNVKYREVSEEYVKVYEKKRREKEKEFADVSYQNKPKQKEEVEEYKSDFGVKNVEFDVSSIPSHIQYDILPLPSKGLCYKHGKSSIPVAYLTAADENLISSPNMYLNGNITDVILKRKILDKDFNVDEMCEGDRDAVLIWLRATAYGDNYPIITINPKTGDEVTSNVKLSGLLDKYKPFDMKPDENGLFTYKTKKGDVIKFKINSYNETVKFGKYLEELTNDVSKRDVYECLLKIDGLLNEISYETNDKDDLVDLSDIVKKNIENFSKKQTEDGEKVYKTDLVTQKMLLYTVSVNGNEDKEFVKQYIENMVAFEAKKYREFVADNEPGLNKTITINVPEEEGGGSYETFFRYGDYIFINV